jgi:hypothetical protein
MKRILLICCILLSIINGNAQQISFSDSVVISLITCSPGEEVYAKFGHTAIRLNDKAKGVDIVFNYGLFSFETESFYFKFIKGETDYQLGVYETSLFLPEYKQRNSTVWEQILNLSVIEKRKLINSLLLNYEPQNRIYRYNFVFDNCATRPRDKILTCLNGFAKFEPNADSKTFRQWIGVYVGNDTWLKFGIDLIFGMDADVIATKNESMFLPEKLMSEFQTAQIVYTNNQTRKLISERKVLVSKNENKTHTEEIFWAFKPMNVALILLIIGTLITLWDVQRKRHLKWVDSLLFIVTGLTGFVLLFLMFFSSHPLVKMNFNLLWLNPLNVALGILMWIKDTRLRRMLFFYQIFNMSLYVIALFVFALSIQAINIVCFPLIVLLLFRATSWFDYTKRKLYKRRDLK